MSATAHALVVALLLTVGGLNTWSQQTDIPTGIISGVVRDNTTQAPITGATVLVVGTTRGAISKSNGQFTIRDVPSGVRELRVTAVGFDTARVSSIVVSPGKPVTVTVRLTPTVVQLQEAVVIAESFRTDVQAITSTNALSSEEVRRAPGVQEDVVRAIALLPGVATTQAGRNDLAVRGGAPFENLFLVDNIEVPNINHFGSQGSTGGPLSLINVDLVEEVSLSTGGFGPKFGDRLSSVTSLSLRNGNRERLSGEVNLSTTGFSLIGEGPVGNQGSFFFAARRSYLDLIFNLAGFGFIPEYWDFAGKLSYDLGDRDQLSFLAIGALDKVQFNNSADNLYENSRVVAPSQNQYFSGLTWKHLFDNGFVSTTLGRTYSVYNTLQQDSLGNTVFRANSEEGENSLRIDAVWLPALEVELSAGATGEYASTLRYNVSVPGYARLDSTGTPAPLTVDTSFNASRFGAYAQASWQVAAQWRIQAGGRLDAYPFLKESLWLSPRLSLTFSFSATSSLSLSGGRYYQAPQFIWLIGDPMNREILKPLRADQAVLGWSWLPRSDMKVQVEVYGKLYADYPVRLFRPTAVLAPAGFDDINEDIPFGLEPLASTGVGRAYGIEFYIQKKLSEGSPFYGLASITFNRTEFQANDGQYRLGRFDTPFIGTVALGWRPDDEWEVSGKVRTSEGLPITPYITTQERSEETGFPIGMLDFGRYNEGGRLPFFYAVDLRVDKRWFFAGWQLITYLDVQNVTGNEAVSNYQYNPNTGLVEEQRSIGVLPSIGINIEF